MNYVYDYAEVAKVVDGDTIHFKLKKEYTIDFGFKIIDRLVKETVQVFRLARINTPEKSGTTKEAGLAAQEYLVQLLNRPWPITVESVKADKYGRYLAEIYMVVDGARRNINDEMVAAGHAVPYMVS